MGMFCCGWWSIYSLPWWDFIFQQWESTLYNDRFFLLFIWWPTFIQNKKLLKFLCTQHVACRNNSCFLWILPWVCFVVNDEVLRVADGGKCTGCDCCCLVCILVVGEASVVTDGDRSLCWLLFNMCGSRWSNCSHGWWQMLYWLWLFSSYRWCYRFLVNPSTW